jgi:thiol-disulfide isomerase/thioredoxin
MKIRRLLTCFALLALFAAVTAVRAQDPSADLKALVGRIQEKIKAGKDTSAALAPELAAFDALVEKYKSRKDDESAQIAFMRAMLYLQVLDDGEKAKALFTELKSDFAGTKAAEIADRAIASIEADARAKAAMTGVIGKPAPELHFTWASRDGLKTLSDLKGKVVVLDFWATWCGPCIMSFPEIREVVDHYKDSDVVVLGVTSIQGRVANLEPEAIDTEGNPAKELKLMPVFMKAKTMTWPVVVSDEPVFNPDYGVSGIPHMAIVAPDGTVRHNGMHPSTPQAEKFEKIDAILKEFRLKIPGEKKA